MYFTFLFKADDDVDVSVPQEVFWINSNDATNSGVESQWLIETAVKVYEDITMKCRIRAALETKASA